MANGRGGNLDPASPLAREPFLAVAEMTGAAANSRIVLAAPISPEEIERLFAAHIVQREEIVFDAGSASLRARFPSAARRAMCRTAKMRVRCAGTNPQFVSATPLHV